MVCRGGLRRGVELYPLQCREQRMSSASAAFDSAHLVRVQVGGLEERLCAPCRQLVRRLWRGLVDLVDVPRPLFELPQEPLRGGIGVEGGGG